MTHSYSRLILSFALIALLAACGSNAQLSSSKVTINISSGRNASSAPAISKAAPVVSSLSLMIIVTAPDMDTITHGPISLASTPSGSVISETVVVPNGNNRTFTAELVDTANVPVYSGSSTADLAGTPLSLDITVGPLFLTGTRLIGTKQVESGSAIARDKSGNIFVAGLTYGDLTNPTSSPTSSTSNAFVMKFDISGAPLWTHQFSPSLATTQTPTLSTAAFGAAADANGNVIVVGLTGGNLFETTDYHGFADCFVTKFDGSGKELWTKLIGGADDDFGNAVTIDDAGNIYVTGQTKSSLTGTTSGLEDVFVAKFDAAGNQQWLTQYGTANTDVGTALAVDKSGNVYVTGYTYGVFAGLTGSGSEDAFITKLGGAGNIIKTNQGGSPDVDMATAIAIDNTSGMIYVAGTTYGSVGTPANIDATGNSSDIFVVKFDSTLANPLAMWQFGSAPTGVVSAVTGSLIMPNDTAQGIAVDAAGNIFVTGSTNGVFPGNTNAGGYDSVVIKLQPTGTVDWYQQLGTTGDDNGSAIVMDNKGNALVAGTTDGNNFDGITSFGLSDVFLMSYDTNGVKY